MHDLPPAHEALPTSYRVVLGLSLLLLFLLGVVFLTRMNQRIDASFQLYGTDRLVVGRPAVVRLVRFDDTLHRNVPALVTQVALEQNGRRIEQTGRGPSTPALPADFLVNAVNASAGPALLHVTLAAEEGETRTIDAEVTVLAASEVNLAAMAEPILPVHAPRSDQPLELAIVVPNGGLADSVPNRVWLRSTDDSGKALRATVRYSVSEKETSSPLDTGRLGIAPLTLVLDGPNEGLAVTAESSGATSTWREMIGPDKLAQVDVPIPGPEGIEAAVWLSSGSGELGCFSWSGPALVRAFQASGEGSPTRHPLPAPTEGFEWLTCSDTYLSQTDFQSFALVASQDGIASMRSQLRQLVARDPLVASWPAFEAMSDDELRMATDYLFHAVKPKGLLLTRLASTREQDTQEVMEKSSRQRSFLLVLMGLIGFGLVAWTAAVVLRNHLDVKRNMASFNQEEARHPDAAPVGYRPSWILAVLILMAMLANVLGLLFSLHLIFG
jgi:hypothetical protein